MQAPRRLPLALAAAMAACNGTKSTDTSAPGSLQALTVRDVVVVHVDTLRQDHLPMNGYERDTLPTTGDLDWLVSHGMTSQTSWTLPSTASAMTGLGLHHHGITHINSSMMSDALQGDTLAEALSAEGYATALFSGNQVINEEAGFSRGFDTSFYQSTDESRLMGGLTDLAMDWLDTVSADQPILLWMQPMDMHTPYSPMPEYRGTWADTSILPFSLETGTDDEQRSSFRAAWNAASDEDRLALEQLIDDLYDEQLLSLDAGLGYALAELAARGREDALVIFTADHGETLADDATGFVGHGGTLRDELLDVPLMYLHPDLEPGELDCLASNTDLAPTILDIVVQGGLDTVDGQSLVEECRSAVTSSLYVPETDATTLLMVSASAGRYRAIHECEPGARRAYDLETDPDMLENNPVDAWPETAALVEELDAAIADIAASLPETSCEVRR